MPSTRCPDATPSACSRATRRGYAAVGEVASPRVAVCRRSPRSVRHGPEAHIGGYRISRLQQRWRPQTRSCRNDGRMHHVSPPQGCIVARACLAAAAARIQAIWRRQVSSRAEARHEADMPTSSGRKRSRSPRGASGTRRSRRPPVALWRPVMRFVWELLPFILLLCMMLAVLLVDPAAVASVIWACLAGAFGRPVQLGAAILLVTAVGLVVWAFWPERPAPPQRRRAAAGAGRRRKAAPSSTASDSAAADLAQSRRRSSGSRTAKSGCEEPTAAPAAQSAIAEPLPPQSGTAAGARAAGKRRRNSGASTP
jgi:hypothetical protein